MKIGIVLSTTPSYSETFFISKIKGLQAHGDTVILYTQSKINDFNLCEVKTSYPIFKRNRIKQAVWFVIVFFKLLFHFKALRKFIGLERKQGVKITTLLKKVYTNAHLLTAQLDWLHFGFTTMALGKENVAKSIGANLAVSLRGFDIAIYPVKYPDCYKLLWQKVDKVHYISNDLLDLAYKNGLSAEVPTQKITPAIDCDTFNNIGLKQKNFNKVSIITIARLHWKKGLIYSLQALALLKESGVDFKYTIIGEGEMYEELVYIIKLLGLENNVEIAGKKSPEIVKKLLCNHDLYLQYSISEGFCNAVLEAQAMGLFCIVSDAEGLTENILHEKTGWVVPKRNSKKLAEAIQKYSILSSPLKNFIIENAKFRVAKEFNIVKQQKEFVEFYK